MAGAAVADEPAKTPPLTLGGYAEAYWQKNFNDPSNGVTSNRAFDDRSDTPTLANVVADGKLDVANIIGRLTLQMGETPTSYYAAEPGNIELWKYFQQAYAGYRFTGLGGLELTGGIFLSPIGPESLAVHDSWNWSRSNIFYGLPAYHSGVRAMLPLTDRWAVTLAGYTGWNTVVDNNGERSLSLQATYTLPRLTTTFLYFGGVERSDGAPEGRAWRHLLDLHATFRVTPWLETLAHVDAGIEPNHFGTSSWAAGALYAQVRLLEPLYFAVRGDLVNQWTASNDEGRAAPIFWDGSRIGSITGTLDYRPWDGLSLRLEQRFDKASEPVYYGGTVLRDSGGAFIADRTGQGTLTLGATAWF